MNRKPRIGLALGTGASRGWSHIGVIKALLAEGIEPQLVSGSPGGSGGVLHNLKQQAKAYSSSVFPRQGSEDDAPNLIQAIASSINIFQDRITRSRLVGAPADVLLQPRAGQIGMLESNRAAEAIHEGERCVRKVLLDSDWRNASWR